MLIMQHFVEFMIRLFETIVNNTILNSLIRKMVSTPAYRVIFGELANFFVSFDRWQFYIFHRRNHSYSSFLFLSNVYTLMNMKGTLAKIQMDDHLKYTAVFNDFLGRLDFKSEYTDAQFQKISQSSDSFIANNSNLFVYSLPLILLGTALFYAAFRLAFEHSVSRVFRKYCFAVVLLFMFFTGNIEQFTFFLFKELLLFFSANFTHKIVNVVLLLLFFVTIFMSVGCYFWLKTYYRRHARLFTDNCNLRLMGLICCSFDNGLMCLCLGAVHCLLLPFPIAQLILLMMLEALWIFRRVLHMSAYATKLMVWVQIVSGFSRLCFQLTCLAYQMWPIVLINERIHVFQIYLFLLIMLGYVIIAIKQLIAGVGNLFTAQKAQEERQNKAKQRLQNAQIQNLNDKLIYANKNLKIKQTWQSKQTTILNLGKHCKIIYKAS